MYNGCFTCLSLDFSHYFVLYTKWACHAKKKKEKPDLISNMALHTKFCSLNIGWTNFCIHNGPLEMSLFYRLTFFLMGIIYLDDKMFILLTMRHTSIQILATEKSLRLSTFAFRHQT